NVNPLELARAFFDKSYLSHATAIFYHGLTEQVVRSFYISKERPTPHQKQTTTEISNETLRVEFMKPARRTTNYCQYKGYTYHLVERGYAGRSGVIEMHLEFENKNVPVEITNLERTLVDCIISPHYAGGLLEVIKAFKNAKQKLKHQKLYEQYQSISCIYPYWQRIGLVLEKLVGVQMAQHWHDYFGKPKSDFYIDKEYRGTWDYDQRWQVYYPKGVF
ncbi:MAG: hypothetical protein HQM16_18490, partial [Deltaproteobacteria bacterium]|nr:hypothetical protein [Deltaproteobacteria bacterium]